MIDFYTFTTPNGRKVSIMLEETGLEYATHVIDIRKGDQFTPEFVAVNPNSKIPAIVDQDTGLNVFESGAILIYLAEKTGKFLPTDLVGRSQTLQWLMFQMGGVGPMFGQMNHFRYFAPEQIQYGIERYTNEAKRLLGVLDKQLSINAYLAGNDYTIADMATLPWINSYQVMGEKAGLTLEPFPQVKRWHDELMARPAVQRGMKVPE